MNITRYNHPSTNVARELNHWVRNSLPGFGNLSKFLGFDDFFNTTETSRPPMDVFEDESGIHLRLLFPGVRKQDIGITLDEGILEISASAGSEAESSADEDAVTREESYLYRRSVTLPEGTDTGGITARLEHGILEVTLPKAEERKPRQIDIN